MMSDDYHCHIPRLPWHAGNDYRWGLTATAAQWVDRVIEAVPSRVSVVMAHSMGATAVLRWLVADVDRDVDAIVLVSPYYRADPMGSGLSVLERLSLDIQHASRAVVRSMYGERVKNVDPEIFDHIAGKFYDRAGPQAMMAVCEVYLSTAGVDLSANKIPIFVLGGTSDDGINGRRAEALSVDIPNTRVVFRDDLDHFCHTQQTEQVYGEIMSFLEGLPIDATERAERAERASGAVTAGGCGGIRGLGGW
jgi:pimeloyl-ACP methyl ester carboxylesterase